MPLMDMIEAIRGAREDRGSLVPMLMESLVRTDIKAPPGPKSWLGVSRLPTICPKAVVMAHRLQVQLVDEVDLKGRWNMDRGTGLHVMVQELWLGPMGYLLGGWQCPRCAHIHGAVDGEDRGGLVVPTVTFRSAVPMPEECEKCKLHGGKWHRFRFIEPEFRDLRLLVSGKSDGLLHMAPNPIEVMDLKTTGTDFDKTYTRRDGTFFPSLRDAPRKSDVGQLQWYLDAAGLNSGRLIYLNPGADSVETAMVEHKVAFDPVYMHNEKEKLRGLREALEEEARPVPDCPYDGAGPYGECSCVEVAVLWARSRR